MATRPDKRPAGIRTRQAVLDASKALFLRQGYHATGMREIAREAGISLSTAYNHFAAKEQILEELLADNNFYAAMACGLSRARGDTAAELLQSGFHEIMIALQGKSDFIFFVFIDILEFQGAHVAKLAGRELPKLFDFFHQIMALGGCTGELRDVHPALLGRAYLGMIFSSFIIENLMKSLNLQEIRLPLQAENWEQGMVDILLNGILKDAPRREGV